MGERELQQVGQVRRDSCSCRRHRVGSTTFSPNKTHDRYRVIDLALVSSSVISSTLRKRIWIRSIIFDPFAFGRVNGILISSKSGCFGDSACGGGSQSQSWWWFHGGGSSNGDGAMPLLLIEKARSGRRKLDITLWLGHIRSLKLSRCFHPRSDSASFPTMKIRPARVMCFLPRTAILGMSCLLLRATTTTVVLK